MDIDVNERVKYTNKEILEKGLGVVLWYESVFYPRLL